MSSHIIYDKQFVKLSDGRVIPIALSGDSNCTEMKNGYERFSRDWHFIFSSYVPSGFAVQPADLIAAVTADIEREVERRITEVGSETVNREDVLNHFGWYTGLAYRGRDCGKLSAKTYLGIFATGCKHALTFAELKQIGVALRFDTFRRYYPVEHGGMKIPPPSSVDIQSDEQFFTQIEVWRAWAESVGNTLQDVTLGFSGDADGNSERLQFYRRSQQSRRETTDKAQDHFYVLANGSGSFLVRYLPSGYRHAGSTRQAKRFATEAKAERYCKSLVTGGKHHAESWSVQRIDEQATFKVAA